MTRKEFYGLSYGQERVAVFDCRDAKIEERETNGIEDKVR
jgi:hypothetical protein